MRYIVILNDRAGAARKEPATASPEALRAAFAGAGISAEVQVLPPDRIEPALAAAAAARPDAVVIGGGDGTVRCAAAALADTGVPLGVLPLGTLNHFAKDLKMPADPREAVAALAGGRARAIDVAEVNGHVFVNNCSLGAYADAVRRRDALRAARHRGKWWAMGCASWQTFRHLRRLRLKISVDGGNPRTVRTPVVVIGNNRYSGHLFNQNLRPRLDEGRLWLYTVHAHRHLAVLRMMLQSMVRRLDEADALAAESATGLVIESESGVLPVAADGEVLDLQAPLRFRIRPGALRVIVPVPPASEDSGPKQTASGRSLQAGDSKCPAIAAR